MQAILQVTANVCKILNEIENATVFLYLERAILIIALVLCAT